jgi:anion-transporting  ArsA/GET3 family ATPase
VLTLPDLYRAGLDASDVERLADRWAPNDPLDTAGGPPGSAGADSAPSVGVGEPHSIDAMIEHASVIVCCGSGGVGKTTTAAAIGLEAAAAGRRVVVVTIDPARRLADALGLADGLAAAPQRIELPDPGADGAVGGEMWAMMLDAEATFDDLVRREAGDDAQVDRILSNRFYRNIAGALSGTQEYMASEMLHQLHVDERFDLVVVDTPPSRNALDFIEAPGVLARFLDHRVFKLMMLPTKGGLKIIGTAAQPLLRAIGKVVGSDVLADSVAFFQAFAGMEAGFRERAGAVMALIRADATSFVIVTSPHHDTIEEAVWFAGQLADQGVGHDGAGAEIVIVNRVHPAFGPGSADDAQVAAESAATDGTEVLAALWRNVAELRAARERELVVVGPLQELVSSARLAFVPLLERDVHDLDGLRSIAGHLGDTGR